MSADTQNSGRLLIVPSGPGAEREWIDTRVDHLERWLGAPDLLVVNDAATLPACLQGRSARGDPLELRLLGVPHDEQRWRGVLLGAGDFRIKTEDRPPPPELAVGDVIEFPGLRALIVARSRLSPRLVDVRFDRSGEALWAALYRVGRPVQYAHEPQPLPLYAVQTAYGQRPWAAEMPSAGWPLRWSTLLGLRRKGVGLVALTHAAGLSATGDPAIDAALPLPERYEIPEATVLAIERAHAGAGRVIAVGTSVVRALEGRQRSRGNLSSGAGVTDLIIDAGFVPQVVDGLLTGVHDSTESHFRLLQAFADARTLSAALDHALSRGYRGHEFGDSMLLLPGTALSMQPTLHTARTRPHRSDASSAGARGTQWG
jgi:S-adenosylmethionine:tRNA ribosyltransferase-isomerase